MRRMLVFSAAALCLCLAAGCGSGGGEKGGEKQKVIGAAMLTQTHIFYQDMVRVMREDAEKRGVRMQMQFAEFDLRRQNDQIDTFIAKRVDAIVVAPADSSGIGPAIASARAAGIPVFTVDIAAHGADVVSHIASDNELGGKLVAEYLVKALNGQGKIGLIDHPTVSSVQDRTRGFDQVIAQHPGMTVVQRVPGDGQRDKSLRATQDLLQAHPDINAIFGINDDSALGALAAVEAAGLQDKIIIVGFDGTPEARETILAGKALKADAVQYPDRIAARAMETIMEAISGREVPRVVPVEVGLIDQESLKKEQGAP